MADNAKGPDGIETDPLPVSKYLIPSTVYTPSSVSTQNSSFMDSTSQSKGNQSSLLKKYGFHVSNFVRAHTEQKNSNDKAISSLKDAFDAESKSIRDHQPPLLSQTDTFEADTDSEDEDKKMVNPSTYCIGGLFKNRFQTLGSSFGTLLGVHVPVRVIDKVPKEESFLEFSAPSSTPPSTPRNTSSVNTVSSPCNNSVRSEETLPSLPGLFSTGKNRAFYYQESNKRVLLSPQNASLLDGFSDVDNNNFESIRINETDLHSIRVLLSKASKAETDQNYLLSLNTFRKCLKELNLLLKSEIPEEEQYDQYLQIASVHHSIATLHWKMGDYDDSLVSLKEATTIVKMLINRYGAAENILLKERLCNIFHTTGKVYSSKGDYKCALSYHEESLSILKSFLVNGQTRSRTHSSTNTTTGSEEENDEETCHPCLARSLISIGTVHAHCGRLTEAMDMLKSGLDIQLKLIGPHHVDIAATLNAIGSVYEKSGRHEKAMQCYKKARQIYFRQIGDSHVDVAVTMNNIAQIYHYVGKYQKAMETYREALRLMKNILGNSHRNVAAIMFNMGLVHVQCCQYSKALEIFQETLQMQRDALGDFHVDVALTLESIGSIYEQSLKIRKALDMYSKALLIRQKTLGDHLFVGLTMDRIGKCQMNLNGDIKEALACFEKSIHIYQKCGINDDEPLVREAKQNYDSAASILRKQKNVSI